MNSTVIRHDGLTVLIADDHPIMREGIAAVLQAEPGVMLVAAASNGEEAVELFQAHRPDVIDIRLHRTARRLLGIAPRPRQDLSDCR